MLLMSGLEERGSWTITSFYAISHQAWRISLPATRRGTAYALLNSRYPVHHGRQDGCFGGTGREGWVKRGLRVGEEGLGCGQRGGGGRDSVRIRPFFVFFLVRPFFFAGSRKFGKTPHGETVASVPQDK